MIPKVKFEVAPLEHYIKHVCHFLNPGRGDWDWSNIILKNYPKLKEKLRKIKAKKQRNKTTYNFFREMEKNKKLEFIKNKKKFKKEWGKINDKVMRTLSVIVETKWPKNSVEITCFLTLNPICPRDIKKRTFDLFYKSNIWKMKAISLHEILHFIYFEKWKQIFPKTKEREFEAPHLIWFLSEMVPPSIQKDRKIQKIFKHKPLVYKELEKCKINGKPLLKHIQEFYDKRKDFADFLKQSWKFVKKHEKEIKKL